MPYRSEFLQTMSLIICDSCEPGEDYKLFRLTGGDELKEDESLAKIKGFLEREKAKINDGRPINSTLFQISMHGIFIGSFLLHSCNLRDN
jgi:hypothetical protein